MFNPILRLFNRPAVSVAVELLKIGVLGTIWVFLGNVMRSMQKNLIELVSTKVATMAA